MVPKVLLFLMFCCASKQSSSKDKKDYLVSLSPQQVMEAFDGVLSEDYIKLLAKDFATKAAAHFMTEITNQKKAIIAELKRTRFDKRRPTPTKKSKTDRLNQVKSASQAEESELLKEDEKKGDELTKTELNDREALRLLEAPSPDGDNLDTDSGELTDEDKNKIPVIQLTKINGIYYRRLLGMI